MRSKKFGKDILSIKHREFSAHVKGSLGVKLIFKESFLILDGKKSFIYTHDMLMIRMQRVGRRNDPAFRVVLCEKRSKPKSGQIEILGSYHPKTKETTLRNERISYWLLKGAQLSETACNLLASKGIRKDKA